MILERFTKQPTEVKDYDINYAEWLTPITDTLVSAVASVVNLADATDVSLVASPVEVSPTAVKVWMSGGVDGQKYKVTVRVTTTGGRIDESELLFTIKDF